MKVKRAMLAGCVVLRFDAVDGVAVEGDHAGDVGGEGAAGGGHGALGDVGEV